MIILVTLAIMSSFISKFTIKSCLNYLCIVKNRQTLVVSSHLDPGHELH